MNNINDLYRHPNMLAALILSRGTSPRPEPKERVPAKCRGCSLREGCKVEDEGLCF